MCFSLFFISLINTTIKSNLEERVYLLVHVTKTLGRNSYQEKVSLPRGFKMFHMLGRNLMVAEACGKDSPFLEKQG